MYLDPGFGSMVIQVVVAAIATCGVAVFILTSKIKKIFKKRKTKNDAAEEEER